MIPDVAIILAAGEGKRLKPLTNDLPKCLINIEGRTFLERSLRFLLSCGFQKVCIVTGYQTDKIAHFVREHFESQSVRLCCNSLYANTNNAYSLWLALKKNRDRSFLLIDGDLLFEETLLNRFLEDRRQNLIAVEMELSHLNEEAMKVVLDRNGIVQKISKEIPLDVAHGEFIGMAKFSKYWAHLIRNKMKMMSLDVSFHQQYYEDLIQSLLTSLPELYALPTKPHSWIEVDTLEDLKKASMMSFIKNLP